MGTRRLNATGIGRTARKATAPRPLRPGSWCAETVVAWDGEATRDAVKKWLPTWTSASVARGRDLWALARRARLPAKWLVVPRLAPRVGYESKGQRAHPLFFP
ncbi:hypothetical protein E2562_031491 [Oryza meyeriana var. granulata]|uniref:Uncharacterized protein n=1 Tax=Oryza meyeriana var. granulata TaxID=110450 RepID=A0A6G1ERN8_9ORYZ|nr:hypothetical protein E2562_031491 [Oryza meyeriana var. granulata]